MLIQHIFKLNMPQLQCPVLKSDLKIYLKSYKCYYNCYWMVRSVNLKAWRKKYGYSQKDLAIVLNCDQSAYSKYETGKVNVSNQIVSTLADFYHVTIDDFTKFDKAQIDLIDIEAAKLKDIEGKSLSDIEWQIIYAYRKADKRAQSDAFQILKSHKAPTT